MDADQLAFLKRIIAALDTGPLEPDDPRRVPVRERAGPSDPVETMWNSIRLSDTPTLQLFTGFSGSGKTTELLRLKRDLEQDGYFVLYVNALDYFSLSEPPTIGDLLVGIAGSFGDALDEALPNIVPQDGFWRRITDWITNTETRLIGAEASVEYSSPAKSVLGGLKAGLKVKSEFKTGSNFFRALQQFLANSLAELERNVQDYVIEIVEAVKARHGADIQLVLIFDQLERMRGYDNWHSAIRAARALFTDHRERLQLPGVHCVYSVPAWLTLVQGGIPGRLTLPTVALWEHTQDRGRRKLGYDIFRDVVRRRINDADAARLFGPMPFRDGGPIDRLIEASSGHLRDLMGLLRRTVRRGLVLPVDDKIVDGAIAEIRREFGPIAMDDAMLLFDIARLQDLQPASMDAATLERLSFFMDSHIVSYFENGPAWYDVHPLLRDEIVQRHDAKESGDGRHSISG